MTVHRLLLPAEHKDWIDGLVQEAPPDQGRWLAVAANVSSSGEAAKPLLGKKA